MAAIERESPTPLYHQLKELLAERIASGDWQPGDMLPTEEQLQEQYQISRTTVRQALKELEVEGQISRQRGRGTFVTQRKISHSAEPHFRLADTLLQQGEQPGWKLLRAEWVPASPEIAERLNIEPDTPVFELRRLRLASDEAIGYHVAYASPSVATAIDRERLESGGSLDYLRGNNAPGDSALGENVLDGSYANRILEAIPATEQVAEWLDVAPGTPMFLIRREVLNRQNQPIELLRAIYRGDRLQYHVRRAPAR
ncbi:MAG TPA: GntR family transcriptional regulator [Candidatus Sulfomarinibacteraceae bacterium]|nr:GntR family transcriptional regulator [Candidatus Sulfomarinibacteraceae bacterium]